MRQILLVILNAELDRESDELLQIAEAAGETRDHGILWLLEDPEIRFLNATIEHFNHYGRIGTSEAERRWRAAQVQQSAEFARHDALIADCISRQKKLWERRR